MEDPVGTLCAELGEDTIRAIVAAFYRRVPGDDLLGPMYPEADYAGAERRLADFLAFRCGGSRRYVEERGHPRLRMRHAPFAIDRRARDRWVALMTAAIAEIEAAAEPKARLLEFLDGVATFLINRAG